MTAPQTPPTPCAECGSALAGDQRYCLQCGRRNGPPRVDPLGSMGVHPVPAPARDEPVSGRRRWWTGAAEVGNAPPRRAGRSRAALAIGTVAVAAGVLAGWASGPAPVQSAVPAGERIILADAPPPATPAPTATPTAAPTPTPAVTATPTQAAPALTETATPEPAPTSTPDESAPVAAATPTATATPAPPPALKHVWIAPVATLKTGYAATLVPKGTLLSGYAPAAPNPVAEGIALLSGQPPTAQSKAGCPAPTEVTNVDATTGIARGDGCRYPASVLTLPGQLAGAGLTWKAYVADPTQGCPAPLNAFDSLDASCARAPLSPVPADTAPSFAWLAAPDDPSLQAALDPILAGAGFADGGLVVLDAADGSGALLLSPLVSAGASVATATGPYALLRTLEDAFGLVHLAHAADAGTSALGTDVFPAPTPTPTPTATP